MGAELPCVTVHSSRRSRQRPAAPFSTARPGTALTRRASSTMDAWRILHTRQSVDCQWSHGVKSEYDREQHAHRSRCASISTISAFSRSSSVNKARGSYYRQIQYNLRPPRLLLGSSIGAAPPLRIKSSGIALLPPQHPTNTYHNPQIPSHCMTSTFHV